MMIKPKTSANRLRFLLYDQLLTSAHSQPLHSARLWLLLRRRNDLDKLRDLPLLAGREFFTGLA